MLNHVGHLTLVPEATDAQVDAIISGLLGLPGQVDGLAEARAVRDAGLTPGNATLRFHMCFETIAAWQADKTHPAHVAVVTDHIGPVLASKAFVQYGDDTVRVATA
jgi:hypothetical protein